MKCLHPSCPAGPIMSSWQEVLDLPALAIRAADKPALASLLSRCGHLPISSPISVPSVSAPLQRVLDACPCLYSQLDVRVSARAVVHLCEITLGAPITSSNVVDAFEIQHPSRGLPFRFPPVTPGAGGGDIMEALCSEVLDNEGVPHMKVGSDGWPVWGVKTHVSLNSGGFHPLKLYGDILVPCAPHNLLISVKSEAARERFVVSGNRLESIGFGFFSDASEFWTTNRMGLLKRWGFVAVYMPTQTLNAIEVRIQSSGTQAHNVNINGRPLYRDLRDFGSDVFRVAGKLSSEI